MNICWITKKLQHPGVLKDTVMTGAFIFRRKCRADAL